MFQTATFWLLFGLIAALLHLLPATWIRVRAVGLAAGSVLVIWGVAPVDGKVFAAVLLVVAWVATSTRMVGNVAIGWLFAPVAGLWIFGKQAGELGWTELSFVGLSFLLIKAGTLLKDTRDGLVGEPDVVVVAAYLLFFPTYMSGPMHLFGEFERSIRSPEPLDLEGGLDATLRILLGFAKLQIILPLFRPLSLEALVVAGPLDPLTLSAGAVAYSAVIWASFSGYTDLAIGTSKVMGVQTPENFNYPFAARNIREFWQRWHITFTRVLTNYLFVPMSRALQQRLGRAPRTVMMLSTLGTFLFCGYWHGPTLNFVLWGLFHAVGLIVYDFYRSFAMRRRLQQGAALDGRTLLGQMVGVIVTFLFVSAGWILFVLPIPRLLGG